MGMSLTAAISQTHDKFTFSARSSSASLPVLSTLILAPNTLILSVSMASMAVTERRDGE